MSQNQTNKPSVVYLSTYPPRQCGIATFTADLTNATGQVFNLEPLIVAVNTTEISHLPYPEKVLFEISQTNPGDYLEAAQKINRLEKVKLVNIQHEFGIFGGEYGSYILTFMEELKKPIVTTFHTVIPNPGDILRETVRKISDNSKGITVMTGSGKEILEKDYSIDPGKIQVIPHGIHSVNYKTSEQAKQRLWLSGSLVLSTFGLLGPGKGIEFVLDALPPIIEKFPNVRFLIIGATHPVVLKQDGEAYRNFLTKKVYDLGLANNVIFYNNYLAIDNLLRLLEATDVYISSSLDPIQAVSGTLSYALGSGRPVVSTAFAQAKQDITDDVGVLVGFRDPGAFTNAILRLLEDGNLRTQMGKNAYFRTRHMIWQNVANSYVRYFAQFTPELYEMQRELPQVKMSYLTRLTDPFGIIQFAKLTEPDTSSGYTLDDNARALIVSVLHYKRFRLVSSLKLAKTYLDFISYVAKPDGYYDNYVEPDKSINTERNGRDNLEDSTARGLYALTQTIVTKEVPKPFRIQARKIFDHSFKSKISFSSPRAAGFYIKALYFLLSKWKDKEIYEAIKYHCEHLVSLYTHHSTPDWEWFEHHLTYSNAILPEALLLGYKVVGDERYLKIATKTVNSLIDHTFKNGIYMPIGQSGWFIKGGKRQFFDQQPEDVAATVEMLNTIYQITHEKKYNDLAYKAFYWFLGENVLGQIVYDRTTGGCYDGIGENFINLNQGAESTIAYLTARLSFEE